MDLEQEVEAIVDMQVEVQADVAEFRANMLAGNVDDVDAAISDISQRHFNGGWQIPDLTNTTALAASYKGPWRALNPSRYVRREFTANPPKKLSEIETTKELYNIQFSKVYSVLGGVGLSPYLQLASAFRKAGVDDINTEFSYSLGIFDCMIGITVASLASILVDNALKRKALDHRAWNILRVVWNIFVRAPLAIIGTAIELGGFVLIRYLIGLLVTAVSAIVWYPISKAKWEKLRAEEPNDEKTEGDKGTASDTPIKTPLYQDPPPGYVFNESENENMLRFSEVKPVEYPEENILRN